MEEKVDARKLSRDVLEDRRRQARKLRKRGMTRKEIGEIVGAHPDTVGRWLKLGAGELAVDRGGRRQGQGRHLTAEQEAALRRRIVDRTPEQLDLPYALWTRRAVGDLIRRETGLDMPIRTVGEYLKRWGFTPQWPVKRAYE